MLTVLLIFVEPLGPASVFSAAAEDRTNAQAMFFSDIEDFPLMSGLSELPNTTLIFDSPSGRYVEAYAAGKISIDTFRNFYQATLPQLGWQSKGIYTYQREGEVLEISIVEPSAVDGIQTIRFSISPYVTD